MREFELSLEPSENSPFHKNGFRLKDLHSDLLLITILTFLGFETVAQFVAWSSSADKTQIASVAFPVLQQWRNGNVLAQNAVEVCLAELADDCTSMIMKFAKSSNQNVNVGLTGSLFTKNEDYAKMFQNIVRTKIQSETKFSFEILHDTVLGALRNSVDENSNAVRAITEQDQARVNTDTEEELADKILPSYLGLPQTECRNEKSMKLDTMPTKDAIELFISEEISIYDQILKQKESIEMLVEKISIAFRSGGRLFYVGAGTSGRLGILDASECPPTFRSDPEMVQGIIAGGFSSVSKAKEGAEDSIVDGMTAITDRNVNQKDIVVGIAASGRTPFVWGAIHQANILDSFTAFLTFNTSLAMKMKPDIVLAMNLGPEILTGSTRLKSGSATKCILNILSTLAMVKIGKCFENLMVDLNPANQKLKERAARIVLLLTSNIPYVTEKAAKETLMRNDYDIKKTVMELREPVIRN
jgi:N-acetylmuramic acid 6-phosphate etherase